MTVFTHMSRYRNVADGRVMVYNRTLQALCSSRHPTVQNPAPSAWEEAPQIDEEAPQIPELKPEDAPGTRRADDPTTPSYYGDGTYEVMKVIEAWGLGFKLGNAVKYIARAGKKDPAKEVEDLRKAREYLRRRIGQLLEA